jgi:glycosyltransferase involved in cell wall biosynthesis
LLFSFIFKESELKLLPEVVISSIIHRENFSVVDKYLPESVLKGIFIVVPAYNEGKTVREVVQELLTFYPNVIVVDDGSCDETYSKTLSSKATLLRHLINLGQGASLQTGIDYSLRADAKVIVTFDADGQHCAKDVAKLVVPIIEGEADIVLGSRFLCQVKDIPFSRKLLLKCGILFTRIVSGVTLTDVHNGLRAFSRRFAEKLNININRMAHASEIIDQIKQNNLCYKEVPVQVRYTEYSRKKGQSTLDAFKILTDYILERIIR